MVKKLLFGFTDPCEILVALLHQVESSIFF